MDKKYETKYYNTYEKKHWWSKARRGLIKNLITGKHLNILDVGCGSGCLIKELDKRNKLYGIDTSRIAVKLAIKKGLKNIKQGSSENMPYPDSFFDIIISSDVLEHVDNEEKTIKEITRITKRNGKILVFVPAFPFLWSSHDDISHHKHRYAKQELINKFSKHFAIEKMGYWNFFLFIPLLIFRKLTNLFGIKKSNFEQMNFQIVNNICEKILLFENWLIRKGVNFPLGASVFIVGRKKHI